MEIALFIYLIYYRVTRACFCETERTRREDSAVIFGYVVRALEYDDLKLK